MNREFITYEQALALKELGFDEPCFGYYDEGGNLYTEMVEVLKAPLYQQAFRWFREKYGLEGLVYKMNDNPNFFWFIIQEYTPKGPRPKKYIADCVDAVHKTYEEAESACLNKFIEIYMDFYKLIR